MREWASPAIQRNKNNVIFIYLGPKTTNQVITTIPFIVFVEDCIFVRDVITIYPWVVAIEVLGMNMFFLLRNKARLTVYSN